MTPQTEFSAIHDDDDDDNNEDVIVNDKMKMKMKMKMMMMMSLMMKTKMTMTRPPFFSNLTATGSIRLCHMILRSDRARGLHEVYCLFYLFFFLRCFIQN